MSTFTLPETMRINGLAEIKDQLNPLINAEEDLELDASNVSSLDTSGIQLIIAAHLNLDAKGKSLTVKDPSEALMRAVEVCGAESLLSFA